MHDLSNGSVYNELDLKVIGSLLMPTIDAIDILCAQLTRDLFATAKFLLFLSELRQISTSFNKFW